jgi:small nuclear ribonucleoprotein (snRNP)-like protein
VEKTMSVITCDGRSIIGRLRGFDQTLNVILEQSHERLQTRFWWFTEWIRIIYDKRRQHVSFGSVCLICYLI